MTRKRSLYLPLSVGFLAAVGLGIQAFEAPHTASAVHPTSAAEQTEIDPVTRDDLRSLSARVDALARRAEAASAATVPGGPPADESPAAPAHAEPVALDRAQVDDFYARQIDVLNGAIERGQRDSWSHDSEHALSVEMQRVLRSRPQLGELDDVVCSSEICRVRLLAAEGTTPGELVSTLSNELPWPAERFFQVTPTQPPELVMFASREGHAMPKAELIEAAP